MNRYYAHDELNFIYVIYDERGYRSILIFKVSFVMA